MYVECTCMHARMYVMRDTQLFILTQRRAQKNAHVCMYVCMYVCMSNTNLFILTSTERTCMHVSKYVCMYGWHKLVRSDPTSSSKGSICHQIGAIILIGVPRHVGKVAYFCQRHLRIYVTCMNEWMNECMWFYQYRFRMYVTCMYVVCMCVCMNVYSLK